MNFLHLHCCKYSPTRVSSLRLIEPCHLQYLRKKYKLCFINRSISKRYWITHAIKSHTFLIINCEIHYVVFIKPRHFLLKCLESERSRICMLGAWHLLLSMIFLCDFGTVPKVWYYFSIYFGGYSCSSQQIDILLTMQCDSLWLCYTPSPPVLFCQLFIALCIC